MHIRLNGWLALIFFSIFLAGMSVVGYKFYPLLAKPMLPDGAIETVILDKNTPAHRFADTLLSKNLIKSKSTFLTLLRWQKLTPHLKAGVYETKPNETALQFIKRVVKGDVLKKSFAIIEGTTQNQISSKLFVAPFLNYSNADWQDIQNSYPNAEGLLLADTYNYNAGSDAKSLLNFANKKLVETLNLAWQNRSSSLPYKNSYELLIAASILEKETSIPAERRLISGVIVNRINKKMPLQMDPTVIYALGPNYRGKLSHEDMSIPSAYNTYINKGLPPTPIAMVGKDAILAASQPLMSNYLYFVAKGDGTHHFSANYEDQKKAIRTYQKKGKS